MAESSNQIPDPTQHEQPPHFWDPNGVAAHDIRVLAASPDAYERMDTVINAWDGILYRSFPQHTRHRGGDFYSLPLRRHAGAWGDGWGRSIVVQLLTPDWDFKPGVGHGGPPPPAERTDVAWVELAAPSKARSRSAWRDLMQIAVDRLAEANTEGRLLLILVAGFRWMPFMWDPVEPRLPGRGPLVMKGDGEDERWPVDPRVHMVLREGEVEPISRLTFDPLDAYTLDYWTKDESGAVLNLKNLLWLEKLLAAARPGALAVTEESDRKDAHGCETSSDSNLPES